MTPEAVLSAIKEDRAKDRASRLIRLEGVVREFLNRDFTHLATTLQSDFRTMTEARQVLGEMAQLVGVASPRIEKV